METEQLVTVAEAARALGVQRRAVEIAIREERLPAHRVLGHLAIDRAALEEYRQRTQPGGRPATGRPRGSQTRRKEIGQGEGANRS